MPELFEFYCPAHGVIEVGPSPASRKGPMSPTCPTCYERTYWRRQVGIQGGLFADATQEQP